MEQGTEAWLQMRKGKVTASKIPIIMGESPYQTAFSLWQQEMGLEPIPEAGAHMKRGLAIENEARDFLLFSTGIKFEPKTVVHPDHPKFMASLDGISECERYICEIKNNNLAFHMAAVESDKIPYFHQLQMQWQMYVTGTQTCYYLSYRPPEGVHILYKRDDELIEKMVEAAHAFLRCLDDGTPPPLTDKDYVDLSDDLQLKLHIEEYRYYSEKEKSAKAAAENCREMIIERSGKKNCRGEGWKVTHYTIKGRVDYDAIPELNGVDINKYRKPGSTSYRITLE